MCLRCTRPLAIQDIDEFVLRNLALLHLLINGSSAVNGCRQNEESPNSCFSLVNGAWSVNNSQYFSIIQFRWDILFTGGSNSMDYGLIFLEAAVWSKKNKKTIDLLFINRRFSTSQDIVTNGLDWCGLLVDCFDVFISCLDSHSDGTHSLQRIHWWASDGTLHFSKSDEETNSSTSWMAWGWVFSANFHFWVNFSFNS